MFESLHHVPYDDGYTLRFVGRSMLIRGDGTCTRALGSSSSRRDLARRAGPIPRPPADRPHGRRALDRRGSAAIAPGGGATMVVRSPRVHMISRIDKDHSRFREIVRGKIRQNLRK